MAERFRINEPTVAFEEIDGEVVVINFDNGHYHALNGVAAEVFAALGRGYTAAELVDALLHRYDAEADAVAESIDTFIATLHERSLLVPDPSRGQAPDGPAVEAVETRAPFTDPALESYDDMEEFLLLDPIHEVDDAGWPRVPEPPPEEAPS